MTVARTALALAAALLLGGCAGSRPAPAPLPGPAPAGKTPAPAPAIPESAPRFTALAARFTDRAVQAEREGDPRRALESWRVVAALRPEAGEPRRRVEKLEEATRREADRRYGEGLRRLEAGEPDAARREFLLALAANPDHGGALEALRTRLDPDVAVHVAAEGETFAAIAGRYLGDPGLGPIVARLNGLDPAGNLKTGSRLLVPLSGEAPAAGESPGISAEDAKAYREGAAGPQEAGEGAAPATPGAPPAAAPAPAAGELAAARRLFEDGRFREAAAAAERAAGKGAGRAARELAASSWFAVGDRELEAERFDDAEAAYRRADPEVRDVAAAVAAVGRRRAARADELYNEGVRFFIDQKLDEAIAAWEHTLALNPEHPKAPKDLEKARALRSRLQELR